MAVFRFRVTFEDKEDIYRDIDINAAQTFEDLHAIIQRSIDFDNIHSASFFISDDHWKKGAEITLKETDIPTEENKGKRGTVRLMKKCKIAGFIDDPHQKFVYVYDFNAQWTLLVELIKIVKEESGDYPKIFKTVGVAPKQYKKAVVPPPVEDDVDDEADDVLDKKADKIFHADEEFDHDAHEGDGMGEEGEDDITDPEDEAEEGDDAEAEGDETFGAGEDFEEDR